MERDKYKWPSLFCTALGTLVLLFQISVFTDYFVTGQIVYSRSYSGVEFYGTAAVIMNLAFTCLGIYEIRGQIYFSRKTSSENSSDPFCGK